MGVLVLVGVGVTGVEVNSGVRVAGGVKVKVEVGVEVIVGVTVMVGVSVTVGVAVYMAIWVASAINVPTAIWVKRVDTVAHITVATWPGVTSSVEVMETLQAVRSKPMTNTHVRIFSSFVFINTPHRLLSDGFPSQIVPI